MIEAYHETKVPLYLIIFIFIGSCGNTRAHMVHESISKLVMHFFNYEILRSLEALFWGDGLQVPVELAMHFLEDPHALLVPIIHLSQQREIVSCVLIEDIVFYYHHL